MKRMIRILWVVMVIFLASITPIVYADSVEDKELCINGKVYIDLNIDGIFTEDELKSSGTVIELTELVNRTTSKEGIIIEEYRTIETAEVNENGEYNFKINPKNKYKIILNSDERKNYVYDDIEIVEGIFVNGEDLLLQLTDKTEGIICNSIDIIDIAYSNNEISISEQMLLYTKWLFADELPERFKSNEQGPNKKKIDNIVYNYLRQYDDTIVHDYYYGYEDNNVIDFSQNNTAGKTGTDIDLSDLATPYELPNGHFTVWYTIDSDAPNRIQNWSITDENNNNKPDCIEHYAEVMEDVYDHLVVTNGYREPLTHPDNDRINIYLGGYLNYINSGWTYPTHFFNEINQTTKASADIFINIYDVCVEDLFRSIFAHELFHAIVYAYRYTNSDFMKEAMSTYWEQKIPAGCEASGYESIRDYLDNTYLSLNHENSNDQIYNDYGAVIFFWYLEQNVDNAVFKQIIEKLDSPDSINYNILEIIESVLLLHNTNLDDVYTDFAEYNYDLSSGDYDGMWNDYTWGSGASVITEADTVSTYTYSDYDVYLNYLSTHYYKFAPSSDEDSILDIIIDGENDGNLIDGQLVLHTYLEDYDNGSIFTASPYYPQDAQNNLYISTNNMNSLYEVLGIDLSNLQWEIPNYLPNIRYDIHVIEHILGPWTVTQAPTCSTVGSKIRYCINANCSYSETVGIPNNLDNHVGPLESIIISNPTCTEHGESGQRCTICNGIASRYDTQELGHDYSVLLNTSYQTYSSTQHRVVRQYQCSRCVVTNNDIQYATHSYNIPSATCEVGKYCTICGYVAQSPLGHNYSAATCTAPAVCLNCAVTTGSALGHSMSSWYTVTASTCYTHGTEERDCTRSGCSYYETNSLSLDSGNHSGGSHWEVVTDPTCTVTGSQQQICNGCGAVLNTQSISALGHSMSSWSVQTPSTCCIPGTQTRTCTRSGCSYSENGSLPLNPNNHSGGSYWTVTTAATCTASGIRSQKCYGCSAVLSTQTIPALGHNWGSWIYQYTYYDEDLQYYVRVYKRSCSRCGAVEYDYLE